MALEPKVIKVTTLRHNHSDLLMAFSDDLLGLLVPARSHDELMDKIPGAVREILEAQGFKVSSVTAEEHSDDASRA